MVRRVQAAKALADAPVHVTWSTGATTTCSSLTLQVATAALSPADIAQPIRSVLRGHPNEDVILPRRGDRVAARRSPTRQGRLPYDYLVLAAGANHAYFGHDEWAPNAPGLKTLEDALDIRRRILMSFEDAEREPDPDRRKALMTFVVVGGGPTGVEMAGAIAEIARFSLARDFRHIDTRDARVILIEASTEVLAAFPDRLSRHALRDLERLGVDVRFGQPVTAIAPDAVTLATRSSPPTRSSGRGCAVVPPGTLARCAARPCGTVLVNPDLTVPGHPEIFVIGDMASLQDARGSRRCQVWRRWRCSRRVGRGEYLRAIEGKPGRPFRYRDLGNMATIGRNSAVADIRGLRLTGFVAWLAWAVVHISI